jgi:hypothetical protein
LTFGTLFYLIRTKDLDWLEALVKYSNKIMSRECVMSIPRDGSKREAAAPLLNAYARSRVTDRAIDVPPGSQGGSTTDPPPVIGEIPVATIAELDRSFEAASPHRSYRCAFALAASTKAANPMIDLSSADQSPQTSDREAAPTAFWQPLGA